MAADMGGEGPGVERLGGGGRGAGWGAHRTGGRQQPRAAPGM